MGHKVAWHRWQTYEISCTEQKKFFFYPCNATCPVLSASQLLAELLSPFGACSARCSIWLGCVLATHSGLTWSRGTWWQYKVSKWGSPFAGASWEVTLHCRFGRVCCGSFVIQHTSAPSVVGLVGCNWEALGWQQGEGDAQWKSLWALLGSNITQWEGLKGFKGRKWRGVS